MMQPKLQMTKQSKTQLIQVLTTNLGRYVYTYKQQKKIVLNLAQKML